MNVAFWDEYSKSFTQRILNPRNLGFFHENETAHQQMRVVVGEAGMIQEGNKISISLVVDTTDGVIADAKFQAYGESTLIGTIDAACEWIIHKHYEQVKDLQVECIDRAFLNLPMDSNLFKKVALHLDFVLIATSIATKKCIDLPHKRPSSRPHLNSEELEALPLPHWDLLNTNEKLNLIQKVIHEEVRPFIELDSGGIEVLSLRNEQEVIIAYHGACASCPASTGTTLDTIQHLLRSRLSPTLKVIPDPSFLQFTPFNENLEEEDL